MKITYNYVGHGFGPRGDARLEMTFNARLVRDFELTQMRMAMVNFGPIPADVEFVGVGESKCLLRYSPRYCDDPSEITMLSKEFLMEMCKRFAEEVDKLEGEVLQLKEFLGKTRSMDFTSSVNLSHKNPGEMYVDLGMYNEACRKYRPEVATPEFQNCYKYGTRRLVGKVSDIVKTSDEQLSTIREEVLNKIVYECYLDVGRENIRKLNMTYRVFGNVDEDGKKLIFESNYNGQFRREIPFRDAKDLYDMSKTLESVYKVYELEAGVQIKEPTPEEKKAEEARQDVFRNERLAEERKFRQAKKNVENQWNALIASFKTP